MREMKDSGVPWIGEIPKEWMVCRIKHVLMPGKDGIKIGPFGSSLTNKVNGEGVYKIYGQWNIVNKDFSAGKNYVSEETFEELRNYMVYTGDVLISMMGTIGKCAIIPCDIQPGIMDSHVIKARLDKSLFIDRYFERVFDKDNSSIVYEQMQKGKKGSIMDGLNSSIVKNLIIPFPSIDEQQRIADFLDAKCAELDTILDNTRASIEDYKALKLSVITKAVTKGIRGERPMKDSGVEWIGAIPADWDVMKIKWLLKERNDRSEEGYEEPLSMSQKFGIIPTKDMDMVPNMASSFVGAKLVYRGDLVFNKLKAHLGVFAVSEYEGLVSPDYAVYYSAGRCDVKYLERIFKTPQYISEFRKRSTGVGAGLTRLYTSDLFDMYTALPSETEQKEISAYLDDKCATIDSLIASKEALITELEAYKKSLIYEYVSGKKEVI